MASFYLIDRKAKGGHRHSLAWKFDTPKEVALFLRGKRLSRWIIVKNGKRLVTDRAVNPASEDIGDIEKACEEA
jgi:hypothetical protein